MQENTGSFEQIKDFRTKTLDFNPDYYREVGMLVNNRLRDFIARYGKKPLVADIGSAGIIPFDTNYAKKVHAFDLYQKPEDITLPENVTWHVYNILDADNLPNEKFDFIILSGLLHHLADKHNNIKKNTLVCFNNIRGLLSYQGSCLIFEGVCFRFLNIIQDIFYPLYSWILIKLFHFTYARLLTIDEVKASLKAAGLEHRVTSFRQPNYVYVVGFKIPARLYPVRIFCYEASKAMKEQKEGAI